MRCILDYLDEHPNVGILIGYGFMILGGVLMYLGFRGLIIN